MNGNKPSWYKGPGWYVNHVWIGVNLDCTMEPIYICDASRSRDVAAMIARESGYLGDTLQVIDLGASNE